MTIFRFLKRFLSPGRSLQQKVVRGSFWVVVSQIFSRAVGLAQTAILARLLTPDDFGLFGIALLVFYILETFSETGIRKALIQLPGDIEPALNTAWTIQIVRGLLVSLIIFFCAPLAGQFFREPNAIDVLRVISLTSLMKGFLNPGIIHFQKELDFAKQFLFDFGSSIVSFAATIVAAFILRNAWALVISELTRNLIEVMLSFLLHPYRPRLSLVKSQVQALLGFGKWITATKILKLFILQGDDLLIGRILGDTALGFYQMSFRVSERLLDQLNTLIGKITFPAFSKISDKTKQLRSAYLRSLQVNAIISFPIAIGIVFIAPEMVPIVLGNQWTSIVPTVQILAIQGLVKHVDMFGVVFNATGNPKYDTYESIIRLSIFAATVWPALQFYGITGVAASVLIATFIARIWSFFQFRRILELRMISLLKALRIPSLATVLMVGALVIGRPLLHNSDVLSMVFSIIVGATVYLLGAYLIDKYSGADFQNYVLRLVSAHNEDR